MDKGQTCSILCDHHIFFVKFSFVFSNSLASFLLSWRSVCSFLLFRIATLKECFSEFVSAKKQWLATISLSLDELSKTVGEIDKDKDMATFAEGSQIFDDLKAQSGMLSSEGDATNVISSNSNGGPVSQTSPVNGAQAALPEEGHLALDQNDIRLTSESLSSSASITGDDAARLRGPRSSLIDSSVPSDKPLRAPSVLSFSLNMVSKSLFFLNRLVSLSWIFAQWGDVGFKRAMDQTIAGKLIVKEFLNLSSRVAKMPSLFDVSCYCHVSKCFCFCCCSWSVPSYRRSPRYLGDDIG